MAYLKKRPGERNWLAIYKFDGKKRYKSTRIPHTTGDSELDAINKAQAQKIADLFQKASRREMIKKKLHMTLDEIIDEAM